MKLGIGFGGPANHSMIDALDAVVEAEKLGVDHVWAAEAWGGDAVTPIAYLAARTERIRLGTGIMQISARVPSMIAMTASCLSAVSNGRFILGLGVSGPQVVEGLQGVSFKRPLTRMRETVAIVRKALRGEKLEFQGREFVLPRPGGEGKALRLDLPPRPGVPIFLATLGPKALAATGEIADGWLGTSFSPDFAEAHLAHLRAGAEKAGRTLNDLELQTQAMVAIGQDVERLVEQLKPGVAFALGAMGSSRTNFYNEAFQRAGYQDDALAVQRLWFEGRRDAAAARVPDDLVLRFGLVGTPEMVRERVRVYAQAGIGTINLRFPRPGSLDDRSPLDQLAEAVDVIRR